MTVAPACAYEAHRLTILRALEAGAHTMEELASSSILTHHIVQHTLWVLKGKGEVKQVRRFRRAGGTSWRTGYELARPSPDQRLAAARAMLAQGLTPDEAAWCLELTDAETQALAQEAPCT